MFLKLMTDYGSRGRDQRHVACLYVSYTSACTREILFVGVGTYIIAIMYN